MKRILFVCAFAAMAAGCAGGAVPPVASSNSAAVRAGAPGKSWMLPEAKGADLLYVSDLEDQSVFIYTYGKAHKLVGTLTGFFNPEGLCVDKAGNVWVTNDTSYGDHQVIEYAHGATSPLQTLDNPYGNVNGCAVDPKSGDLAVANFWGPTEHAGGISIYAHGKGSPVSYTDPNIYYYYFCGYDDAGNLYTDGLDYGSSFGFAVLPKGKSSFKDISLNQAIYLPGGVQWDGEYLAVGDQVAVKNNFTSTIYEFSITGTTATEVGMTTLTGSNQVSDFWLPGVNGRRKKGQATTIIGPNQDGHNTLFWNYPDAGSPIDSITGQNDPIGATISLAKRR